MLSRDTYLRIERELRDTHGLLNVLELTLPVWEQLYWRILEVERKCDDEIEIDASLMAKLLAKLLVDTDHQNTLFS